MEKFLYPKHPLRCIIAEPSSSGKSVFLTKLLLNVIKEYDKMYIYSPSFYQDLNQKLLKSFSNYIPFHIFPNILKEEDLDLLIKEVINNKDFEKSDIEIETFEGIEELKYPQEYNSDQSIVIILDDLNQKEIEDIRVQARFKASRHKKKSIFIISQNYYELSKKTIRCNGNIYQIFKPNKYRDVQNLYQVKASMDMILNEFST